MAAEAYIWTLYIATYSTRNLKETPVMISSAWINLANTSLSKFTSYTSFTSLPV